MLDKMIINVAIDFQRDAARLAALNHLVECAEGRTVYYQSSALGNIDGFYMKVAGRWAQVKGSVHKLWNRAQGGGLDNYGLFRMADAVVFVPRLLASLGLDPDRARVTYYEVGLNLPLSGPPSAVIGAAQSVGALDARPLYTDANYGEGRQKTSEKVRTVKKVFKLYDKSHEVRSKGRACPDGILRAETVYRRQDIPLEGFLARPFVERMQRTFYRDWAAAAFARRLEADKGVKLSQMEKAAELLRIGRDGYLARSRADFEAGHLTAKQFRTVREFIQEWDEVKHQFRLVPSPEETEYRAVLLDVFRQASL